MENCSVIGLFCGAGGLTHGFVLEGFNVVAGFDADESCRYAYETNNNGTLFINKKIEDVTPLETSSYHQKVCSTPLESNTVQVSNGVTAKEISELYPEGHIKVLVGCAPCQPYSPYTKNKQDKGKKWRLLSEFADLICEVEPDIVSMENVPDLVTFKKGMVYNAFCDQLKENGYHVTAYPEVYCPDYGIPQYRTRLVLFASKYGKIELLARTHTPNVCALDSPDSQLETALMSTRHKEYKTVRDAIDGLEPLKAGQTSKKDPLHKASRLSELNLRRIRASVPGGTWRNWDDELVAKCHRKKSGNGYASVYGRMKWNEPSPTITTQCYGFGNGRFGHLEQDRCEASEAISLREAALLQTFLKDYKFVAPGTPHYFKVIGRFIGNAVPVNLARVIAKSIKRHLEVHVD